MSLLARCRPLRPSVWTAWSPISRSYHLEARNHFITRSDDTIQRGNEVFTLAVKDNIATKHLPTTCASTILDGYTSPFDATIVHQLRSRGAVVVGKTNLDEFGMGSHSTHSAYGEVENIVDGVSYSAGGSSGGSALAVRTGEADVALGTDTGGSVRLPAAYTGVVGFKPSYGMVSRYGVVPYANSLDTVGFFSREVESIYDLLVRRGIKREHDPNDPTSLSNESRKRCEVNAPKVVSSVDKLYGSESSSLRNLTVGIPLEYNIEELNPVIRGLWQQAASELEKLGCRIVPISLPSTQKALAAYYVLAPAEASSNLAKYDGVRYGKPAEPTSTSTLDKNRESESERQDETIYTETRSSGFGKEVQRRILLGTFSLSADAIDNYFLQAQRVRRAVQQDFNRAFRRDHPLLEPQEFDLSEMPDAIQLDNKWGPPEVDFILSPTAPSVAPRLDQVHRQSPVEHYTNDVFTVPASLAGLPACSVPVSVPSQAPGVAGLQIIGQYWDDARVLGISHRLWKLMSNL